MTWKEFRKAKTTITLILQNVRASSTKSVVSIISISIRKPFRILHKIFPVSGSFVEEGNLKLNSGTLLVQPPKILPSSASTGIRTGSGTRFKL